MDFKGDFIMDENKEVTLTSLSHDVEGLQAQIDQVDRMIAENHRQIALGDDVEGRTRLIAALTGMKESSENEILEKRVQMKRMKDALEAELG